MDIQHVKATCQKEVVFCPLSELMCSSRKDKLKVAYQTRSLVFWAQFKADVEALVQMLQASSYVKWALCFDDSYHFAVAFMAAAHAGKHIILPGNHQADALGDLASHFDVLLHDRYELREFSHHQQMMPLVLETDFEPKATSALTELQLEAVTITLFTSGSSGQPKAVVKTLGCINAEIAELEKVWGEQLRNANVVSTVSHQHIYGLLFRVLWPLCAGRMFGREDLSYPEQVMAQANPDTVLVTSPALLKRLNGESVTQPYRAVFSSGGPLSEAAALQSNTLFGYLPFEVFGSTETGGIGFRQQHQANTPWQLFDVIDMALNAEGCLRICSPFIAPDSWYQTSDQCQIMGERHFSLQGRTDRVVKVEEKRISLIEVERRLCQLCWIDEAAVLTLDEPNRLVIAAVITLTDEGRRNMQTLGKGKFWLDLRQQLRRWLEPVGIPRRFRDVGEIPLNSQGKRLVRDLEQFFK